MSKKLFLKRSYADVVKGETEENHAVSGESVLKPKYLGFQYTRLNNDTLRENQKAQVTPQKRSKKSRGDVASPIVIDDSESITSRNLKNSKLMVPILVSSSPEIPNIQNTTQTARKTRHFKDDDLPSLSTLSSSHGSVKEESHASAPNSVDSSSASSFSLSAKDTSSNRLEEFKNGYLDGNMLLPIFQTLKEGIKTMAAVKALLHNIPETKLAKAIPNFIPKNVSFIYSSQHIDGHWKNALCDGMGVWKQTGKETKYVDLSCEELEKGETFVFIKEENISDTSLKVVRHKYVNQSCRFLHRIAIHLENPETCVNMNQFLVQYYFERDVDSIEILPHRNSKADKSHRKTAEDIKERIRSFRQETKHKVVYQKLTEEAGGLEEGQNDTFSPRNRQLYNVKGNIKLIDPVVECSDLAKHQEKFACKFIRDVRSSPEFTLFLASDRQLLEVEKFCTANKNCSVLGVDTTFNIGQYHVTFSTYRNMMLLNNKGVEPVMIGPTLVHQNKSFNSYFKLPSTMLQECPGMKELKVFGTDGDANLYSSIQAIIPKSKHVVCDIHMHDSIKRKLKQLDITGSIAREYIKEIFGAVSGDKKNAGLVDAMSVELFETALKKLGETWKDRHENGGKFWQYFLEYKADQIKNCLSAELRRICGLGFPPKPYTQNANECMNSVIKSSLNVGEGKKNINAIEFARKLENVVKQQENEVKLALIGKGEYKLKNEYQHLLVNEDQYWRKSAPQREAVFNRMLKEPLKTRVMDDEIKSSGNSLYVSPAESQVTTRPFGVLENKLQEAQDVLCCESSVVLVPGSEPGRSYSLEDEVLQSDQRKLVCNVNTKVVIRSA